ncbi:hypothetical protein [Blastococcus sp. SYSU D00813]
MAVGQGRDGAATGRRGWLVALALVVVLAAGVVTASVLLRDGDGAGTPAPSGELALGDVTEVRLDDDGQAVRTFAAEEHETYLVHTADGDAAFLPPAGSDAVPGLVGANYSVPEDAAPVLVTGEPGATVEVWLHTLGRGDVPVPGEASGELAAGDCVSHWVSTDGLPDVVLAVTADSADVVWGPEGPDEDATPQVATDRAGHPVFDVADDEGLNYGVCNLGSGPAAYELTAAEHLEPGEAPSVPPTVDGSDEAAGELVPGVPVSHLVTVPAGRYVFVTVWPGVGADFDARLTVVDQGQEQVVDQFRSRDAEFVEFRGGDTDRVVGIRVEAVSGGGSYRITAG